MEKVIELKKKTYEQLQQTVIELTLKNCLLERALDNSCEELAKQNDGEYWKKSESFETKEEWKEWCIKNG